MQVIFVGDSRQYAIFFICKNTTLLRAWNCLSDQSFLKSLPGYFLDTK